MTQVQVDEITLRHLKQFTTDAVVSEFQKRDLKKNQLIAWSHGSWSLTALGKSLAEQLGYL